MPGSDHYLHLHRHAWELLLDEGIDLASERPNPGTEARHVLSFQEYVSFLSHLNEQRPWDPVLDLWKKQGEFRWNKISADGCGSP